MRPATLFWFRRDLRLRDHPALAEAARRGPVLGVFVIDPVLWNPAGAARRHFLLGCLAELHSAAERRLVIMPGEPAEVLTRLCRETGAGAVYATTDYGPYGTRRDEAVAQALGRAGFDLELRDSPYAAPPGAVTKSDGSSYRVFTPYYRAWTELGHARLSGKARVTWAGPVRADAVRLLRDLRVQTGPPPPQLATPGEDAARRAWSRFRRADVSGYERQRNVPSRDGTSRLSPYLRWGCIHPRQVLADLGRSPAAQAFARQVAWRDFCAGIVADDPRSARESRSSSTAPLRVDRGLRSERQLEAWSTGATGYPLIDAGMRQLRAEGWMHNRVRMAVASFLVKDLHLPWERGAAHFMAHLADGDLASNSQNWQWVAGTGSDPLPFARIFNPTLQARRFDPDGAYIHRWIPELRGLTGPALFEPWNGPDGPPAGYPGPIVDHGRERGVALERWSEARRSAGKMRRDATASSGRSRRPKT